MHNNIINTQYTIKGGAFVPESISSVALLHDAAILTRVARIPMLIYAFPMHVGNKTVSYNHSIIVLSEDVRRSDARLRGGLQPNRSTYRTLRNVSTL